MDAILTTLKPISNAELWRMQQKSTVESLHWWNFVRWLFTISYLSVGIIEMALTGKHFPLFAFVLTFVGITLLNIVYSIWVNNFASNSIYLYFHNFLDITIFSLSIYVTGGISSPLMWSYLIPILTSSITVSRMAGLMACFFSLLGLYTVIILDNYRLAGQIQNTTEFVRMVSGMNSHNLLSYACLFLLVYFISSFLSNTLRFQNKSLIDLSELLNIKNQQLLKSQEKILEMERKALVDRIARTIQHELNNPLAIMTLKAEMVIKENEQARNRMKPIWESIIRMKKILSKIEKLYSYSYKDAIEDIKILDLYKPKE
jgi:signal transduction histidine kinase